MLENNARTQFSPGQAARAAGGETADPSQMVPLEEDDIVLLRQRLSDLKNRSPLPLFDNDPLFRRIRLNLTISHTSQDEGNPDKRCVICRTKTHLKCSSCGVKLCAKKKLREGIETTCQEMFHSHGICLSSLKKEFPRKRPSGGGENEGETQEGGNEGGEETTAAPPAAAAATAAAATATSTTPRTPAVGQRRGRPTGRGSTSSRGSSVSSRSTRSSSARPATRQRTGSHS